MINSGELPAGTTIGGYEIVGTLGQGGMGVVYEATQRSVGRAVALKLLSIEFSSDPEFQERFRREGQMQALLEHPNIVPLHETGESSHGLFISMRLVRGTTLNEIIVAGDLDARRALRLLRPIASALSAAHEIGLVHRDLKPANILVDLRDHSYLADFGLSKPIAQRGLTASGMFAGTAHYASAEQARGEEATAASDVYALGAVIFAALAGRAPFGDRSDQAALVANATEDRPAITSLRPDLPPTIDGVLRRAMAIDPEQRQASAEQVIDDLDRVLRRASATVMSAPVRTVASVGVADVRRDSLGSASDHGFAGKSAPGQATPSGDAGARPGFKTIVGTVAVTAGLGFGVSVGPFGGKHSSSPVLSGTASGPQVQFAFPAEMARVDPGDVRPRVSLKQPVAVSGSLDGQSVSFISGETAAVGPSLLPQPLRTDASVRSSDRRMTTIGSNQGAVYSDAQFDRRPARVYAIPTRDGVSTSVCLMTAIASAVADACDAMATSVEPSAEPVGLGVDPVYADDLKEAIVPLIQKRRRLRQRLAQSPLAEDQALLASRLADAYAATAATLSKAEPVPQVGDVHHELISGVTDAAAQYRRLGAAAREASAATFDRAAADAIGAEKALDKTLWTLSARGYGP